MSLPARKTLSKLAGLRAWRVWRSFVTRQEAGAAYYRFLTAFFSIWFVYDLLDLCWNGTSGNFWLTPFAPETISHLREVQVGLLVSELAVVVLSLTRRAPKGALLAALGCAFLLRLAEAEFFFMLNDFVYYCLSVFLLLQFLPLTRGERLAQWPRQIMLYQTAWIYLATSLLKLNPHWLSGDHLWIRQQYVDAILGWPHPSWFRTWIAQLPVNHWLAVGGALGEMSMAILLLIRAPRWVTVTLAVAMHGFAALALNVWFFGASMVAQVAFVAAPYLPESTGKAGPRAR